jgi:hypothetical protein
MKTLFTCIAILTFSLSGKASEMRILGDISQDEFFDYFDAAIYNCQNSEFKKYSVHPTSYLKKMVVDSVFRGLSGINRINPKFALSLWRNVLRKRGRIELTCQRPTVQFRSAENTRYHGRPILELGPLYIPGDLTPYYLFRLGISISTCLKSDFSGHTLSISRQMKDECQRSIFHEFLHFAEADNNPLEQHNDLEDSKRPYDVVYACSTFPFFNADPIIFAHNWQQSCQTCMGANSLSTKVEVVDSGAFRKTCEELRNEPSPFY